MSALRRMRLADVSRAVLAAIVLYCGGVAMAAPAECVPADICPAPSTAELRKHSVAIGSSIDVAWLERNAPLFLERASDSCLRYARCISVPGNGRTFCVDYLRNSLYEVCGQLFDRGTSPQDAASCRSLAYLYSIGVGDGANVKWEQAQACARAKLEAGAAEREAQPRVTVEPKAPLPGQTTSVIVKAFDADGDPVMADVRLAGVDRGRTFAPMDFNLSFERTWDDAGRMTLAAPSVIVSPSPSRRGKVLGFEPITFQFETKPSTVRLEVTPPKERWKRGRNRVRVTAFDSETGQEVAGRVRAAGRILGASGDTVELELKAGAPPCGGPYWFAPDTGWYSEADLGVPQCKAK